MITQQALKEILNYNRETGIFHWKTAGKGRLPSLIAGNRPAKGARYIQISIGGIKYLAHRLAFLYEYGYLPKETDHENHNRLDNRIKNLKEVTHKQNTRNRKMISSNTSGVTGVRWTGTRWRACIVIDKKYISLGNYRDLDKAVQARKKAEAKYGFHKNHGRKLNEHF